MKKFLHLFIGLVLTIAVFTAFFSLLNTSQNVFAAMPAGFQEQVVFNGLKNPTAVRFASDGRVFVAEKSGLIKEFDNTSDTTATIVADFRTNVHNFWDRGLLGLALDPNFPTKPYIYILYTYDAAIGGTAPRWGTPNNDSDGCPTPPGATGDGCVVSGRLSRFQVAGNVMTGQEQVLVEDWCQQYPSHSVGSIVFGADGALYASGGDGASFLFGDYGQAGNPKNPCGDPTVPVGGNQTPPTAEGGSLRSQDLRTLSDPTGLNGSIIRVNPDTGQAMPDNPLYSNPDQNAKKIIAYGMRNPFRINIKPGTNELWIGDVGGNNFEEINRITNPLDSNVKNFGWPCYDTNHRNDGFDGLNLNICENLYNQGGATDPYYFYDHNVNIVPGESCSMGSSSISGIIPNFSSNGAYPAEYEGALFFADYSRNCIWAMLKGTNGLPDPANIKNFVAPAAGPVDLQVSPTGEIFYADFDGGTIRKIKYFGTSPTTCAADQFSVQYFNNMTLSGTPVFTSCEVAINNDWGGGGVGNGVPNDIFSARWTSKQNFTAGSYTFTATADDGVRVWVDNNLIIDKWIDQPATAYNATIDLTAGVHDIKMEYFENMYDAVAKLSWLQNGQTNTAPTPVINTPLNTLTWKVGDTINFSGTATDVEDGTLPGSALSWTLLMQHCPSNCHTHTIQTFDGVAAGSFVAPDHEYPSHLELKLTAKDSKGLEKSTSVDLQPKTVNLTFQSLPINGFSLLVGTLTGTTSFTREVIINSLISMNAPSPQTIGSKTYDFLSWSDGGAQNHAITAGNTAATYTANYKEQAGANNGLTAIYYDNLNFTGTSVTKTDPNINFDWGTGKPDPVIAQDTFSVRWTGQVQPQFSENYTFYTSSDDGVRLWVNNQLLVDKWVDQSATEWKGNITLTAGQKYDIKMEYYEGGWDASAKLFWSSPSTPKQIIPQAKLFSTNVTVPTPVPTPVPAVGDGLTGAYYDNADLTNFKANRIDPTVDFNWGTGVPHPLVGQDTFSVRWTGFIKPAVSGAYTFYTQSDDGVRLSVNNQMLINQWNDHSTTEHSGVINLTAGVKYPVTMDFYEGGWDAVARLLWSGPSVAKQVIPKANLYSK